MVNCKISFDLLCEDELSCFSEDVGWQTKLSGERFSLEKPLDCTERSIWSQSQNDNNTVCSYLLPH